MDRMTADMSTELKEAKKSLAVISIWPGVVRTEAMLKSSQEHADTFPLDLEEMCKSCPPVRQCVCDHKTDVFVLLSLQQSRLS